MRHAREFEPLHWRSYAVGLDIAKSPRHQRKVSQGFASKLLAKYQVNV
jgi:hypothetical protein